MRIATIGAGPTGLFTGIGLARRGHDVTVVDRDAGPASDGSWPRRGVMQFHHAHGFRGQVYEALEREAPAALARWLEAGAEPIRMTVPGGHEVVTGVRSQRRTFEAALRATAEEQPGLRLVQGHVDEVTATDGTADGLRVDGSHVPADLVIDASGRSSRVTQKLRANDLAGGPTGIAYTDQVFRLHDPTDPGPLSTPLAWMATFDGYLVLIFVHERGYFSVLIVRSTADPQLKLLREPAAFAAACRAIPGLSEWTEPERSAPASEVFTGGTLINHYRGQCDPDGSLCLPGLVFAGDAVCTTTPNFGRGVATSLMQGEELLRTLDEHGHDLVVVGKSFDAWCLANMKPWVDDHAHMDESLRRRWAGEDVDLTQPLPSDLILAAAEVDPSIMEAAFPYLSMRALPTSLDALEPRVHALYDGGWRPTFAPGPSHEELRELVVAAAPA
jgi:2-polyprenyl-6-methoxyphenol hydroxylase-like FAD-dependent oxidoreductase